MGWMRSPWLLMPLVLMIEVVLMNRLAAPDNFPLSLNPIEALSGIVFTFSYFHIPVAASFVLAVLILLALAWLVTRLVIWLLNKMVRS